MLYAVHGNLMVFVNPGDFGHRNSGFAGKTGVYMKGAFKAVFVKNLNKLFVVNHTVVIAHCNAFVFSVFPYIEFNHIQFSQFFLAKFHASAHISSMPYFAFQ